MVISLVINAVISINNTMVRISFVEGHIEVVTDKECQHYIIVMSYASVQEEDGEELEETAKHTGGHPGINKTQEKVSSRFFWPGIKQDVSEYIIACDRCQRVKKYVLQKINTVSHNVPVPVKVMSQVGIYFMCLKETGGFEDKRGYKYIITAECYFTKYVELGALKTKTGLEVATWIYDIFAAMELLTYTLVTEVKNSPTLWPRNCSRDVGYTIT